MTVFERLEKGSCWSDLLVTRERLERSPAFKQGSIQERLSLIEKWAYVWRLRARYACR